MRAEPVEEEVLRAAGRGAPPGLDRARAAAPRYDDPRVHAAVNCASIGCPALRNEAFTAPQARRAARRRHDALHGRPHAQPCGRRQARGEHRSSSGSARISRRATRGFDKLEDVFARYAAQLSDKPDEQSKLREAVRCPSAYLDYDWSLNAAGPLSDDVRALAPAGLAQAAGRGRRAGATGLRQRRRRRRAPWHVAGLPHAEPSPSRASRSSNSTASACCASKPIGPTATWCIRCRRASAGRYLSWRWRVDLPNERRQPARQRRRRRARRRSA